MVNTVGPSIDPPPTASVETGTIGAPSDAGSGRTSSSPGKIQCGSSTIAVLRRYTSGQRNGSLRYWRAISQSVSPALTVWVLAGPGISCATASAGHSREPTTIVHANLERYVILISLSRDVRVTTAPAWGRSRAEPRCVAAPVRE